MDWSSLLKPAPLTREQRTQVARHERLHLEYARLMGNVTRQEFWTLSVQIDAFERGDPVIDEPRPARSWDYGADRCVNAVLLEDARKLAG